MYKFSEGKPQALYLQKTHYVGGTQLTGFDYWCDSCDHIRNDPAALVFGEAHEDDSFGPLVRGLLCAACVDEANAPENQLECEFCGKRSDSVQSRKSWDSADWYSICISCHHSSNQPWTVDDYDYDY
jgi:hypothetical protein